MKKTKHYSQRNYLFCVYGCFTLLLVCIFFFYFYLNYSRNIFSDSRKHSENLCTSVNNSVLAELNNISTISMNIAYSNMIRTNFKNFSSTYRNASLSSDDFVTSRDSALAIYDAITSIIGPFQSASQINLYTLNGDCVGSGFFQGIKSLDLHDMSWYEPTRQRNGSKYISAPEYKPEMPARGENQFSMMFVSLTRQINNRADLPDGYIEVIQDCNNFFSLADQLKISNPSIDIAVYNERMELVYPYGNSDSIKRDYPSLIEKYKVQPFAGEMISVENNEEILLTYQMMDDYDWMVVVMNPKEAVYSSLKYFRNTFFLIAVLTIFVTMGLCFIISDNLTKPLRKLTSAASKITINRVLDEEKAILKLPDSRVHEIAQLCESIREMYDKLRTSSQKILLSRTEETRAKLHASQSLINPHFLYNSLTTIGIMAEEEMNEDIISLCHSLCDYYRYISSANEMVIPLSEEIGNTEKYIDCMRIRFGSEFSYESNIDDDTKGVLIPKLILQPIVENAFKYGFRSAPPWRLRIRSYIDKSIDNSYWRIEIEDNGGLLDDLKKKELMELYTHLNKNEELKSLQIGGLGLKTVYLRMQLLYGGESIFQINNETPQKTIFILGGPIYRTMEEYYEHNTKL